MINTMLKTKRLRISPLAQSDADQLYRLFSDPEIILHNLTLPRPFSKAVAETWITQLPENFKLFSIRRTDRKQLIGVAGLMLKADSGIAEYAAWMGIPFRGKGYDSEASKALLAYGFETFNLHRIFTTSLQQDRNGRSTWQKIGMMYEGCLRQHQQYWGNLVDLHIHGMLRQHFLPAA
jgi:[ribosomal protein S5]-alanine N-acetyltransferase